MLFPDSLANGAGVPYGGGEEEPVPKVDQLMSSQPALVSAQALVEETDAGGEGAHCLVHWPFDASGVIDMSSTLNPPPPTSPALAETQGNGPPSPPDGPPSPTADSSSDGMSVEDGGQAIKPFPGTEAQDDWPSLASAYSPSASSGARMEMEHGGQGLPSHLNLDELLRDQDSLRHLDNDDGGPLSGWYRGESNLAPRASLAN